MRQIFPENIRKVHATVGDKTYTFRSEGEFLWSQYLEFLKQSGEIKGWGYEGKTFYFHNEKTAPVQYTPDFWIVPNSGQAYCQEFKRGYLDGQAITKLRRMAKHYPDVIIELVLMDAAKINSHRMFIAHKYVRRIISARDIFRQMGNLIKSAKDYLAAEKLENEVFSK